MKIKILSCTEELKTYTEKYVKETCEEQWESLVIDPFWNQLCCYSPINLDERKPKSVHDVDALEKQINKLEQIDYIELEKKLTQIANTLPNYDDDPISVWIIPIDNTNSVVKEQQNGVIGTSLFGNIMIQVNPLVQGYEEWIYYVFAHEYHHTVWGNYWFNLHGNELKHDLLQALVIDGEADGFAMSICPDLEPKWLYLRDDMMVEKMYKEHYETKLTDQDFDYSAMMFGNKNQICWCGGYAVGYMLVQKYLRQNEIDFRKLVEIHPDYILNKKSLVFVNE